MIDYRSAVDLWSAARADRQTMVAHSPVKLQAPGTQRPPSMGTMLSTTADFFPMFDVPFRYGGRSEEHTSELQSLMRISYAVFFLKKKSTHQKKSSTVCTPHA